MRPDRLSARAPSLDDFERLVARAFATLPSAVRHACAELALRVADFPPDDVLDDMGIEDPYELTGLYDGIALTERSVMHQPTRPDAVWLLPPADPRRMDRPRRHPPRPAGRCTCSCTRSPTTSAGPTTTSAASTTGRRESLRRARTRSD